jgi:hypothetical protein
VLPAAVDLTSHHDGFLTSGFAKGLEVLWGCNSAILVRNEITSLSLYHIWKILYHRNVPKWCSPFYGTPADGLPKVVFSLEFGRKFPNVVFSLEFGRRRSSVSYCATELAVLQEFQTWYKPKWKIFIGNTFCGISGITKFFVWVCKDPLNCHKNEGERSLFNV